jgi:type II secretory ATPase GspE/PulE/Tfp pilus assembly ATPase PilB-like protein
MDDIVTKVKGEIHIEKAKEALEVRITMDDALRET